MEQGIMPDTEEFKSEPPTRELPRHRFTMKSLSQLVDDNRLKSGTLPERYESSESEQDDDPGDQVEDQETTSADAAEVVAEVVADEVVVEAEVVAEAVAAGDTAPDAPAGNAGDHGFRPAATEPEALDLPVDPDPPEATLFADDERVPDAGPQVPDAVQVEPKALGDSDIELRPPPEPISRKSDPRKPGARKPIRRTADISKPPTSEDVDLAAASTDDGIDRSSLGESVTRTGLEGLLSSFPSAVGVVDEAPSAELALSSAQPLARHMLNEEIAPGGRLSNPRDVPGIVLNLAKDLPAAAAVSVVRIDEEIELVGNSIDPNVDSSVLAGVFSGVFRTLQVASGALADGPLGAVHDMVIEGEHMDLVLRPLGIHFYLMVLEDRRSPYANLAATRMRMAALAPGLSAILANDSGDD